MVVKRKYIINFYEVSCSERHRGAEVIKWRAMDPFILYYNITRVTFPRR
jgi:hypothetical protein